MACEKTESEKDMNEEVSKLVPIFRDLSADDPDPEVTKMSSLCMNCGKDGTTLLLLTKIRYFKEVVVASFKCDHCRWENNELQPVSEIQKKGVSYNFMVVSAKDLDRLVVKSEWATVTIPEVEFEIPAQSQEGTITSIEGILKRACDGLQKKVEEIKQEEAKNSKSEMPVVKLQDFLDLLLSLMDAKLPFHFMLRDPTGNSFIENPFAPKPDPALELTYFERSREEDIMLGIVSTGESNGASEDMEKQEESIENEVLEFRTHCSNCLVACVTNMKLTHIPHFKDVVLMTTVCDVCGHKTTEVKASSGVEPYGTKITLKITDEKDLKRDVITSATSSVLIPELEFEGTLQSTGGRYTTVEGLITNLKEKVIADNPFAAGDGSTKLMKEQLKMFGREVDKVLRVEKPVTLILKDLCGHCYIQSINHPDTDTNLTVEKFERTYEQNEELGLNDMNVDNYQEVPT